jgi:hypothetical protein
MQVNSHLDKDMEEIFLHIKKLKEELNLIDETNKDKIKYYEESQNNNEKITGKITPNNNSSENLFEIVDNEKTVSKMSIKTSSICDLCGQDIVVDENLSGLVLLNRFFACEECCKDATNDTLNSWIETRKAKSDDVKPIALWLMQEKHKTRLI